MCVKKQFIRVTASYCNTSKLQQQAALSLSQKSEVICSAIDGMQHKLNNKMNEAIMQLAKVKKRERK